MFGTTLLSTTVYKLAKFRRSDPKVNLCSFDLTLNPDQFLIRSIPFHLSRRRPRLTLYTQPLFDGTNDHNLNYEKFADDTQLLTRYRTGNRSTEIEHELADVHCLCLLKAGPWQYKPSINKCNASEPAQLQSINQYFMFASVHTKVILIIRQTNKKNQQILKSSDHWSWFNSPANTEVGFSVQPTLK